MIKLIKSVKIIYYLPFSRKRMILLKKNYFLVKIPNQKNQNQNEIKIKNQIKMTNQCSLAA